MSVLGLDTITFRYPSASADALAGVTLDVEAGETCWLYGAPGAGASTLLMVAAGLAPRFTGGSLSGQVRILGVDPVEESTRHDLRGQVAWIGTASDIQFSQVAETVREEIAFGPANLGQPMSRIDAAVGEALERLGIGHLAHRSPAALSGGEQQRVVMASMLAMSPALWLLDEPDAALDSAGKEIMARVLREEAGRGSAVVIATGDADAMLGRAGRIVLLDRGTIAFDGPPRQLLADELAWSRGPGGTSVAELARAAARLNPDPRLMAPYPLDFDEAMARWKP
ncbi:MAG TPA: energy-coupling factor ABC transporter ATP-binding protein [Gemmatimonadales bacterium]|nr:energy-coupling factor ABC transporter ATP-binding protein [Gemmatimonadales bacterium]